MKKWKNIDIKYKLFISFLFIGIISIFITVWVSYSTAKKSLEESAFSHLTSVRAMKASQIGAYFDQIRNQVQTFSNDRMVIDAMKEFKTAFNQVIEETRVTDHKKKQYETRVRNYYENDFFTRLQPVVDTKLDMDNYWPEEASTIYLQHYYIANNPYPIGSKDELKCANDASLYSKVHAKYHPIIRDYLKKFNYYDIFLVDAKTGHIVYTVFKEVDFATNLLTGPYRNTSLAEAFNAAKSSNDHDFVKMVDFKPYDPSYAVPASFIASPIYEGDEKIGILIFQIPIVKIDQVLTGNENWEQEGLGKSGESYLVGKDFTMRSNSRFLIEKPEDYYKEIEATGFDKNSIDKIKRLKTSILLQEVKNHAVLEALDGKTGQEIISDYRGVRILSSYSPANIKDVDWAILAEIDEAEAFAPVSKLAGNALLWGLILVLSMTVFAFWLGSSLANPIKEITKIAERFATGDLNPEITIVQEDEIGLLAQAFRKIRDALHEIGKVTETIALGNFSNKVTVRSEKDTLGKSINLMTEKLQEMTDISKTEDWLKGGQNQLNDRMRGEQDLTSLTENVLNFLAGYIGALVGVCYLINDVHKLRLVSSYAYKTRDNKHYEFELGEGLIGQAALEKKPILFSPVPKDHWSIDIVSGMGESVPHSIYVLPLLYEGVVLGVLAFGKTGDFSASETELLNRVFENIAVSLNTANSRGRLKDLLEKTQLLAEELETQGEELRQSNEELEEKTQILQESEEKLRYQSEELQAINEELEENNQILEKQKVELDSSGKKVEEKARELALVSKYKTEFLANMSHELRSPLNSLLILAKILSDNEESNLSEKQVESAKIIHKSGQNLLNLISDVLDISKIEAGKLEITLEKIKIDELIDTLYKQFLPVAKDKNINFTIETAKGLPPTIITDSMKAEQILKNLLSNAFKFTSEGSVTLKVHLPEPNQGFFRSDLHPENVIAFSVIDTGIGIPLDKQKIIFEAFQQVDGSISRKFGGTGLGLSISRELSNKLGGEIYIESKEGKGSVFTLFLPLELQPELETTTIPEEKNIPQPKGISSEIASVESLFIPDDRDIFQEGDKFVLVIEDDRIFAKILMDTVHKKGYKCLAAGNGKNGLFLASQYKPVAIMLDIVLPDINGLAVLEQLKENYNTRHIPVHIISVIGERTISLNKGAIGHLTKPISQEAIEDVITKLERVLEKTLKELLIVEDDINNQKAIIRLLENKGVNITVVNSGEEAWDIVASQKFDCIILDLGLPGMTGFQLLDKLHSEKFNSPFELAPVIIYTNRELTREEYLELNQYSKNIVIKGANSPERLLDEVSLFLHSVESSLPKSQQKIIRLLHDPDQVLKNKKILLVDDDLPNTFALSSVLNKYGLDITLAENGQMALEKLDSAESIDLVLMDIMMPVMDGLEATKKIRAQKKYSQLPIIALTAKAMPEDRAKCMEAGANDYLTKPIDIDKLIAMLRIWLFASKR